MIKRFTPFILCISGCILICLGLLYSLNLDCVSQKESDIKKYDEMAPFFDSGCTFVSGVLNIDVSVLHCKFKNVKRELLLDEFKKKGWIVTQCKDSEVLLNKTTNQNLNAKRSTNRNDSMTIKFIGDDKCDVGWE